MRMRVKLATIAALMLLLAIPLMLVVSKIYERDSSREEARWNIAQSWTGEQRVLGPVLVVPYIRLVEQREFDKVREQLVTSHTRVRSHLFLLPEYITTKVDLATEVRSRGIYDVPVYSSAIEMNGKFSSAEIVELGRRADVAEIEAAYLSIVVDDMRGIARPPELTWRKDRIEFVPGSQLSFQSEGIHAPLAALNSSSDERISFSVDLALRGMGSFRLAPVGDFSDVTITSSWPHPGFEGLYLPAEREIGDDGFSANWQISNFASNIAEQARQCAAGRCDAIAKNYLGVALVDPVDVYLQAQRATKYGILFIGLTFAAFFLFEVLKQLAIHPVQYGLVGLALAVFYLLLVSLAEHIAFAYAYLIATAACCGLLGFYITYVLKSVRRGGLFALAIAGLYAALYIIIQAEDYAFSMGSGLVFTALAAVMFITRNIDWYQVNQASLTKPNDLDSASGRI